MSKHKRHQKTGTEIHQIEWLQHRTGYPTPEEREKIIELRRKLGFEILSLVVVRAGEDDPRYRELIKKYGKDEVLRAEQALKEGLDVPSRVADEPKSNREYRLRYSRFGAGLPFYTSNERDDLLDVYTKSLEEMLEGSYRFESAETDEVAKLLLMDWRDWEDLTPLAIPPRPDNYSAPQPASYAAPIAELLEWGNDLDKHHDFVDEQEYLQWKKFIPAITRMALDPGLLNGWPAESASWAPWHAIHILGELEAWESAPALAELADLENDWLSDHLPHIWADMGTEAEPVLWMILEDQHASAKRRGLAAKSLFMMTEENEALYHKVVKGFDKMLQNTTSFDPTLNGHLILFLNDMEALDEVYTTVFNAFEQNRVDLEIITPEDLEEDDFDDDDFDFSDDEILDGDAK
jgi:hypothetical protein